MAGVSSEKPPEVCLSNETRARLEIHHADKALVLAPLERRSLSPETCEALHVDHLALLGYIRVIPPVRDSSSSRSVYLVGFFYGGLAFLLWAIFAGTSLWYWVILGALLAVAAVSILRLEDDIGVRVVQAVNFTIVVLVGIAMPVAAVWAGGDINSVWDEAFSGTGAAQQRATLTLLGRGIQTVFIIAVTLLPGLLYFLFDRYRLSTLGEEFTHQIFRLDRTVKSRGDIRAKYGHLMDEAYGRQARPMGRSSRLQPGTRLPIVIATVVFALGWIVVLLNAEVDVQVIRTGSIRTLITPWQSTTAFAFLGAYVFILQAALRAYLRGDLRPKFYSYAVLRVIVAVVFAWVLDAMTSANDGPLLLATAFSIGLVPDTFLLRLRETLRDRQLFKGMTEKCPLTELEGIDVYDRTRLEQEGVTNVEGLAHSNLVELILQTRIPAGRLVDWTDQAQLYVHLHQDVDREDATTSSGDASSPDATDSNSNDASSSETDPLLVLREIGIRTASDLLAAHTAACKRGPKDEEALLKTLGERNEQPVLRIVIDAISDDQWIPQIKDWHDFANREERTIRYPEDFDSADVVDPLREVAR